MFDKEKFYTITQILEFVPVSRKKIYGLISKKLLSANNITTGIRPFFVVSGQSLNDYFHGNRTFIS